MFLHTLVRDLLECGTPMQEVAELLCNSMNVVEKYYSKWDIRRQARLGKRLEDFWQNDPLTNTLTHSVDFDERRKMLFSLRKGNIRNKECRLLRVCLVDEFGPPVTLADLGAGAGPVTYDWFDKCTRPLAKPASVSPRSAL